MHFTDPVCGKKINRQKAQVVIKHNGEAYFLCCPVCQRIFEKDPQRHVKNAPK